MENTLLDKAISFAKNHGTTENTCFAVALTKLGKFLEGVSVNAGVDSACLCAETGCIAEATKLKDPITHLICISYGPSEDRWNVLPACGICQERLATFGMDVMIGIPEGEGVSFKSFDELRPHFWLKYGKKYR